jgi:eukaryotic-like serine/threonine-protein kinase
MPTTDASDASGGDASTADEVDERLAAGRPEFGSALDGLRARMLVAAGGLARPRTIGRYRLGRTIGSGAFGVVYEAEDPELDRRVAVKLLGVRSAKEAARVVREARLLAALSHPHVVQVFEVGTTDDGRSPYVVMELVEGPTLRQWLGEGPRGWREVVEVMLGVARGLFAAHQAGVVHRDLKPENVLMGRDGRPRVIDFGLARSLGDEGSASDGATLRSGANELVGGSGSAQLTATGQVMGTPAYMAPEVFAGEHSPASDQYALSVTLYEALFGERPFAAESPEALAKQVLSQEAALPADRRGVPRRVARVALRGLRRSPRERFRDLGELVAALEDVARPRRRWPAAVAGLGVLGVSGLSIGGFVLVGSGRTEPVANEAAPSVDEPTLDPRQAAAVAELTAEAERLRTLLATAKLYDALDLSLSLLGRAEDLGHAPTLAEVLLLRGQAQVLATDYEHAIPVLEKAYLLAQEQAMPLVAAHAASELVGVLGFHTDQYENAHRWKDHADGAFQRAGLEPRRHVPYVFGVAGLMSRDGNQEGAMTLLRDVIAEMERDGRAKTSGRALLLRSLGRELYGAGSREAALEPTREAATIFAEHDGSRSLTHASARGNLGVLLTGLERHEEALPHHREALEIRQAILRPEHIDLAGSYLNMGMALGNLGRHDEAVEHFDRSIQLSTARLGPGSSMVAEAHSLRASIHAARGPEGREAALRDYERAARIFDGAGVIYVKKAELARQAIRELGGTPPPTPSIAIPP